MQYVLGITASIEGIGINTFINQYFAELVDEHNDGQVKNIIKELIFQKIKHIKF